jgi:hypothetical protein
MDIRELKNLLKNSTSVLMLDEGEPAFVILDYQVFRNLTQGKGEEVRITTPEPGAQRGNGLPGQGQQPLSAQEMEALERLNKEIQALKEQIATEEKEVFFPESEPQE